MFTHRITAEEQEFFVQLFNSDLAVTLRNVELIASLRKKILDAKPDPLHNVEENTITDPRKSVV